MTFEQRWYRVLNKALELNREVPWIYSDTWMGMFDREMWIIWRENDEEALKNWEQEFRLN